MEKRALWSKILVIVALTLMIVGFSLIAGAGRRLEYGFLLSFGIILAAAGAILSESSSRKLVLWGAGVTAAAMTPGFVLGIIEGKATFVHPIFIAIIVIVGGLSQIAIVVGIIGILLEEKRPASPPLSGGTGGDSTQAIPPDPESLRSDAEIKRIGRKRGLIWGAVLAAAPLLVIGISLLTREGEKAEEPQKVYAEGQYFSVGSTREEVLRIQGPPTFKLEMVWFYKDSQVQFDSDGKVNYVWDYSKNLKVKPEELP